MGARKLDQNISGAKYINLLFSIRGSVKYISLVLRDNMYKTDTINKFLSRYSRNLIETKKTQAWPGTKLEGSEQATIYTFQVCEDFWKEVLKVNSFKNWTYPNRLEDLCFYDQDKKLLLGSVTHENKVFYPEEIK